MKFLPALDLLQENGKVLGIFQTKNPTNIITWDRQAHMFRAFYTHKPQIISRQQLFADDWDVVLMPPYDGFTKEPDENET